KKPLSFLNNLFNGRQEKPFISFMGIALIIPFLLGGGIDYILNAESAWASSQALSTVPTESIASSSTPVPTSVIPPPAFHPLSYPEKYKKFRIRKHEKKSPDLVFNKVRQELLTELFFQNTRHSDLIDEDTRHALYRQESLPPGLQRQVCKGHPLPHELYTNLVLLPCTVNKYLGFQPAEKLHIGVLGQDVLLFRHTLNHTAGDDIDILDVIKNFF
ncbi:MAG: hypothetical protein K2X66_05190, partial [Cyanobacteria bacterium]|nr:hypothetical protein [Cyanobacteriota bacterium]